MDKDDIRFIEDCNKALIKYYMNKYRVSIDEAIRVVYKSKTKACIDDIRTGFYLKFEEELGYLLDLELAGDYDKWVLQADIRYM